MKYVKQGINWLLIIIFITLGFIGILLPLVPQGLFFAVALILISFEFPQVETWLLNNFHPENPILTLYLKMKIYVEKYLRFK